MSITKLQLSSLALLLLAMASPQNALASSPTLSVPGSTCYAMYSADEDHLYRSGGWVVNMSPDKSIWVECPLVLMEGSVTCFFLLTLVQNYKRLKVEGRQVLDWDLAVCR